MEKNSDSNLATGFLRALLIDDDETYRRTFKRLMQSKNYTLYEAASGETGVELALGLHDSLDVVLMDMKMEGLDGIEATRMLRKRGFSKAIIMWTAHATPDMLKVAFDAGADDFVEKAQDLDELDVRVRRHVRRVSSVVEPLGPVDETQGKPPREMPIYNREETPSLTLGDRTFILTPKEALVFEDLWRQRNQPVKKADLVAHCASTRALESIISRLRRKLGTQGWRLKTVPGHGYELAWEAEQPSGTAPDPSTHES